MSLFQKWVKCPLIVKLNFMLSLDVFFCKTYIHFFFHFNGLIKLKRSYIITFYKVLILILLNRFSYFTYFSLLQHIYARL